MSIENMQVPAEGPCPVCQKVKKGLGMVAHLEYDHNKSRKEIQQILRDYPHEKRENAYHTRENGVEKGVAKYGSRQNTDESAFQSALSLAADSPEKLRSSDVDRVMSDAHGRGFAEEFRRWLLSKGVQPDTAAEIKGWVPE